MREPHDLYEEAVELLEMEDLKGAARIGAKLRRMRYTGGVEVGARVLWALGKREKAIAMLEEGVKKAPQVAPLWDYLGSYYSDCGHYEEAMDAYRRASWCPHTDQVLNSYNIGVVMHRQGRYAEVVPLVERYRDMDGGPGVSAWDSLLAWAYNALGRYDETIALTDRIPEDFIDSTEKDIHAVSALKAQIGVAYWEGRKDAEAGMHFAYSAINIRKDNPDAAYLVRRIRNRSGRAARRSKVMVHGRWMEPVPELSEPPGFFATYFVVYEDPSEILDYILPFEPEEVWPALSLEKVGRATPCPGELLGVEEAVDGYCFYEWGKN